MNSICGICCEGKIRIGKYELHGFTTVFTCLYLIQLARASFMYPDTEMRLCTVPIVTHLRSAGNPIPVSWAGPLHHLFVINFYPTYHRHRLEVLRSPHNNNDNNLFIYSWRYIALCTLKYITANPSKLLKHIITLNTRTR